MGVCSRCTRIKEPEQGLRFAIRSRVTPALRMEVVRRRYRAFHLFSLQSGDDYAASDVMHRLQTFHCAI